MFGLLNPLALWLAPLLAAPLLIHFLGRREPKVRDFPSLMPVKGRLSQAIQRHRLKNWLQLLLRTLALLFLLLAAANLLWRSPKGWAPPSAAGLLIHNGAYGVTSIGGETVSASQEGMRHSLDSLTLGHGQSEFLFPEISARESSARFGRYSDALPRLLARMDKAASFDLYLPVFDWQDVEESQEILLAALRQNPHLHLVLTEYPAAREKLTPFSGFSLSLPRENIAALKTAVPAAAGVFTSISSVLWTPTGESSREIPVIKDSVEIQIPISQAGWLTGEISLPPPAGEKFGFPSLAISARIPPPSTLCHVGNAFASLASLGRGGFRSQVKTFAEAQELGSEHCDFLYLADPKNTDAPLLQQAAEIMRDGGKVILGLGPNSDLALLNRNLLEPLGVGRLTELKQHDSIPVQPHAAALAALGMRTGNWQEPGRVSTHVALQPDSGTTVLLSAGDDPILVHRRIGNGELLLWTTDVDNPEWTDVGLSPWVVLIHQAFVAGSRISGTGVQEIASDSVLLFPAMESDEVRVTDPQGVPFDRLERDPDGWRVGPFDRLGLYRIDWSHGNSRDTSWLAVNLASNRLEAASQNEAGARERFLSALGDMRSQVALREVGDNLRNLYGGFRFRTWMLITAALLLFLEGLVSLRLRPMPFVARRD